MASARSSEGAPREGRSGSSARVRRVLRILTWPALVLAALYLLLAARLLGDLPARLAGALSSGNGTSIVFRGLRTDLFWNTSADTVLVTTEAGTTVLVTEASVRGGVVGFLTSRSVGEVDVGRLEISLSTRPGDSAPRPLECILDDIAASIPVSARSLTLGYGRITEGGVAIVDSMRLSTSVSRDEGVELLVDSAGVFLPGFGAIGASGDLALRACTVSSSGLRVTLPPGNLVLSGTMSGPSSSLDIAVDGWAGTAPMGLPVDVSSSFSGTVRGRLSSLRADFSFDGGRAVLFGLEAAIEADTVSAGMDGVTVRGLRIASATTALEIDADLDAVTSAWNAAIGIRMQEADPAGFLEGLPQGTLTGSAQVSGSGIGDSLAGVSAVLSLEASTLAGIAIHRLDLSASALPGVLHVEGGVSAEDVEADLVLDATCDARFRPLEASVGIGAGFASTALAERLGIAGLPAVSGGSVDIRCGGTGFDDRLIPSEWEADVSARASSASGLATLGLAGADRLGPTMVSVRARGTATGGVPRIVSASFHAETRVPSVSVAELAGAPGAPGIEGLSLRADGTCSGFGGGLAPGSWTASVSAGEERIGLPGTSVTDGVDGVRLDASGNGSRSSAELSGSLSVERASLGPLALEGATVEGVLGLSGGRTSAAGALAVDSLRLLGLSYSLSTRFELDGGILLTDSMRFDGPDGSNLTASLRAGFGRLTSFELTDIAAAHSKHRLLSDGGLTACLLEGGFLLDTLWVTAPSGTFGASGRAGGDSLSVTAEIRDLDLTALRTIVGLPEQMSGIANLRADLRMSGREADGSLDGTVENPAYGPFMMDSLTIAARADGGGITIDGLYAWRDGVRSGLQLRTTPPTDGIEIDWVEMEVNNLGDWLFYVLPLPVRTIGASVSARAEYSREGDGPRLQLQASARIERLFITLLGIELPNVNFFINYPDSTQEGFNARLSLGAGDASTGNFSSTWLADVRDVSPLSLGGYRITADMDDMEVPIPGMGAVIASGRVGTTGTGDGGRPLVTGHVSVLEGAVGIPQPAGPSSGGSPDLPFDLSISVTGAGGIWFRTSFADIEAAVKMRIITLERRPTVNGIVSAVRGRITLLQNDFDITEGRVELVQGIPPRFDLNVSARTVVRSLMTQDRYEITVLITGTADNPEIALSGTGPAGDITQEDILTLLAVGVTYGEMQQLNSAAIRTEVGNVAQSLVGSLLARNIRHQIGLDTFQLSPELFADTTRLVLDVGKYVLPSLYVSYKGDVFSPDPGTFSLQYLFSQDLYVEGTTRSTLNSDMEPTLELHYTIRY